MLTRTYRSNWSTIRFMGAENHLGNGKTVTLRSSVLPTRLKKMKGKEKKKKDL